MLHTATVTPPVRPISTSYSNCIHLEEGDCNMYWNVGTASIYSLTKPQKPKAHTTLFIITFMKIVSMMNVKVPSPNFRDAHVMSTELRCLHIPNDIPAVTVLVTNFNHGSCYTIHSLPVNIKPIPGISEFNNWISFKCFFKQNAFNGDSKVDELQGSWNCFGCQLELNGGQVAGCTWTVVHKIKTCARDLQTLLYHLKREGNSHKWFLDQSLQKYMYLHERSQHNYLLCDVQKFNTHILGITMACSESPDITPLLCCALKLLPTKYY